MEKNSKKITHIVIDADIVLSSLLREEGYTQAVLSILLCNEDLNVIAPSEIINQIERHLHEISKRSRLPFKIVRDSLRRILENIKPVEEKEFRDEIARSLLYVKHREDAPLAGSALKYSPSIILTYNKKHFISEKLGKEGVKVFTPGELMEYFNLELKTAKKLKRRRGLLSIMSSLLVRKKGK